MQVDDIDFTLEFGPLDLLHDSCAFSASCRCLNVVWLLAFRLLCMEFRAIDLRSFQTYRRDRIVSVWPIRSTKYGHDLPMVIWTVHCERINSRDLANEILQHTKESLDTFEILQTYFFCGVDYDGCCCDANRYRCYDASIPINCFSSTKPTALHHTIHFGVFAHRSIDCSYRAIPSILLIFDVLKSFVLDCLHCPNRTRCVDVANDVVDAYDAANVQIHVTIHFHCPMYGDYDDVVYNK